MCIFSAFHAEWSWPHATFAAFAQSGRAGLLRQTLWEAPAKTMQNEGSCPIDLVGFIGNRYILGPCTCCFGSFCFGDWPSSTCGKRKRLGLPWCLLGSGVLFHCTYWGKSLGCARENPLGCASETFQLCTRMMLMMMMMMMMAMTMMRMTKMTTNMKMRMRMKINNELYWRERQWWR